MLERVAGGTVCSPGPTQETIPKILVPHGWRPLRNTKEIPLAQSQGNTGLEVPDRARRGFPFPIGLRRNAGEVNTSNPSTSKRRWAPPGEAAVDNMEGDAKCILPSEAPCAQVTSDAPGSLLGCVWYTPHLTVLGLHARLIFSVSNKDKEWVYLTHKKDGILLNYRKYWSHMYHRHFSLNVCKDFTIRDIQNPYSQQWLL